MEKFWAGVERTVPVKTAGYMKHFDSYLPDKTSTFVDEKSFEFDPQQGCIDFELL